MDRIFELSAFTIIKVFNGKTRWEEKKMGDEIEVTYIVEVSGIEYVDKATTSGLSKTKNCEEKINATKRKARELAVNKFLDAQKLKMGNNTIDIDRLFDSLN